MKVQNLSFKTNSKRNSKSYNDINAKMGDRERRAQKIGFKLRKQKMILRTLETFSY